MANLINGHRSPPHPLEQLSLDKCSRVRQVVLNSSRDSVVDFRTISLEEPAKSQLQAFLGIEHSGSLQDDTPRPARLARVQYDLCGSDKIPRYHEAVVDVGKEVQVSDEVIDTAYHASLTLYVASFVLEYVSRVH
jgi:primary-amine oxidase